MKYLDIETNELYLFLYRDDETIFLLGLDNEIYLFDVDFFESSFKEIK